MCILGFAMETLFSISCNDWKEWNAMESILHFEYRVRQKESRRSFLLFYGNTAVSDRIELPVGNPDVRRTKQFGYTPNTKISKHTHIYAYTHTHIHIHIHTAYIYIYIYFSLSFSMKSSYPYMTQLAIISTSQKKLR